VPGKVELRPITEESQESQISQAADRQSESQKMDDFSNED